MKRRLLISVTLLAGIPAGAQQDTAPTDTKPAVKLQVIEGVEVKLPDRSIFYQRVAPPVAPVKPPVVPTPPPTPMTPEEAAAAEARAKKKSEVLFVSATIYDRSITELRWWFENHEYRAWSNVDFNYLAGQGDIETDDSVYTLLLALGNDSAESATAEGRRPKEIPSPVRFDPARAQYFLAPESNDPAPPAEALAAIDALHRYYEANRIRLADDYAKREANRIAQEQWLKEHPPVPKDTVINFWPKKSRNYPTTGK